MHRPIPAAAIRLGQGRRVAAIGLDPAAQRAIHRPVIRVGHNHLVARVLQRLGHPLAFGAGLDRIRIGPYPANMLTSRSRVVTTR